MPTVRIAVPLRSHTDGRDRIEVEGETLGEVLAHVVAAHPALRGALFDGEALRPSLSITVNNQDPRFLFDLTTRVDEGDTIDIGPASPVE